MSASSTRLVADVEVLQEIRHRYIADERPDAIQRAFDAILAWPTRPWPSWRIMCREAKMIVQGRYGL